MTTTAVLPQPASTYQLLLDAARTWPGSVATQWVPDPGDYTCCVAWTYADLAGTVTQIANAELVDLCRRHRLLLVKISDTAGSAPRAAAGAPAAGGWAEVCLDGDSGGACFQALIRGPGLTIIVRPDRVIAAVATRGRLPRLPWSVPAAPVPRASQMIPRPST
jgi:hypothetical protein